MPEGLSRTGQPAETEAKIKPGLQAGIREEGELHQSQSGCGEAVEAKSKAGATRAVTGAMCGDLVGLGPSDFNSPTAGVVSTRSSWRCSGCTVSEADLVLGVFLYRLEHEESPKS